MVLICHINRETMICQLISNFTLHVCRTSHSCLQQCFFHLDGATVHYTICVVSSLTQAGHKRVDKIYKTWKRDGNSRWKMSAGREREQMCVCVWQRARPLLEVKETSTYLFNFAQRQHVSKYSSQLGLSLSAVCHKLSLPLLPRQLQVYNSCRLMFDQW